MSAEGHFVHGLRAAAKLTGWSPSGIQKLVDVGKVAAEKVGRSYTFRAADLEAIRRAPDLLQASGLPPVPTGSAATPRPEVSVPGEGRPETPEHAHSHMTAPATGDDGAVAAVVFADLRAGKSLVDIVAERRVAPDVVQRYHQQWRELKAIDDVQTPTSLERLGHVEAELALRASQLAVQALAEKLDAIESSLDEASAAATSGRREVEARLRAIVARSNGVSVPGAVYQRLEALEARLGSLPVAPLLLPERRCGCGAPLAVLACCPGCGAGRAAS